MKREGVGAVDNLPWNPDGKREGRKWLRLQHSHCHGASTEPHDLKATGESLVNCVLFAQEAGGRGKPEALPGG